MSIIKEGFKCICNDGFQYEVHDFEDALMGKDALMGFTVYAPYKEHLHLIGGECFFCKADAVWLDNLISGKGYRVIDEIQDKEHYKIMRTKEQYNDLTFVG
ncbi:MAG TPA: hypothetical protein VFF57_12110 [Hanamia sp.]|nr:hypothetical protein [Hanamia sp.]